jgi:hypothetical protein
MNYKPVWLAGLRIIIGNCADYRQRNHDADLSAQDLIYIDLALVYSWSRPRGKPRRKLNSSGRG